MRTKIIKDTLAKIRNEISEDERSDYFDIHKDRYMATLKLIELSGEAKKQKLLDIGIWPGHISLCLKKLGFEIFGISKGKKLVNKLKKKGINIRELDIDKNKLPFKNNMFDYVLFTETIEHLSTHPKFVLREIFRILKKDGKLILTTPNIAYLPNRIFLLLGRPISNLDDFYQVFPYSAHKREFTLRELEILLKREKFSILKKDFIMCRWAGDKSQGFIQYVLKILLLIPVFFLKSLRSTLLIVAQKRIRNP